MPGSPLFPRRLCPWRNTMLSAVIDNVLGSRDTERREQPPRNVHELERWASGIGGGLLAILGQESESRAARIGLTLLGGFLVYRALSGRCPIYSALGFATDEPQGPHSAVAAGHGARRECAVIINRPASELYQAWRQFDQLPCFIKHLKEVKLLGGKRSHWVARGPMGTGVEWDAEVINERENELIAWQSLEGSS